MIYRLLRSSLLAVLKAPTAPPDAPAGSTGSVDVFRASPRYLAYRLLWIALLAGMLVLVTLGVVLAALANGERPAAALAVSAGLLVLGLLALAYFFVRVDYDLRYYVVTDRSLRVREGAWSVRELTITHANIQNLRVLQGPLMRLFGIWHLRIDVAGGGSSSQEGEGDGGHHAILEGLENAHAVRDGILEHLRAHGRDSGLGDLDDSKSGGRGLAASPAVLAALQRLAEASGELARAARA